MKSNLSYNYQNNTSVEEKPVIKKYVASKAKIRRRKKVKSVLLLAYITIIATSLIYGKVKLAEVNSDLDKARDTYDEMMYEYEDLQMKASDIISIKNIEDQAVNQYGMTEVKPNQIVNIVVSEENEVEVENKDNTIFDKISDWFLQLKEYILG